MDFFFLAVIFFVASAAIGCIFPIYIVVGSLFFFCILARGSFFSISGFRYFRVLCFGCSPFFAILECLPRFSL